MEVRREFTSADVDFLSQNIHGRYIPSSQKVGHAVIVSDREGKQQFLQYAIPKGGEGTPLFLPLQNIEEVKHNGLTGYRAMTHEGVPMYAMRFVCGRLDGQFFKIAFFSPEKRDDFWSSHYVPSLFKPHFVDRKEEVEEVEDERMRLLSQPACHKAGSTLIIDAAQILVRERQNRLPAVHDVMFISARETYKGFSLLMADELSDEMKAVFTYLDEALLKHLYYSQFYPEWVHAVPYLLAPAAMNPQRADNLGAAPKWANVEMMLLSHLVKWFALNCLTSTQKIKPQFKMILSTELIEHIHYWIQVKDNNHKIELFQDIDVMLRWPKSRFRQPTDLTQATAVVHAMLNEKKPISTQALVSAEDRQQAVATEEKGQKRGVTDVISPAEQEAPKHARIGLT